jgi:imidazolonepropionase-like amidohydrolase
MNTRARWLSALLPLVVTHVTVLDMTGAPPRPDATVVVRDGRIAAVGATGKVSLPRGASVVDGTGKFLIPGLWDMHVHIGDTARTLPLFVANGVTGVRNMGDRKEEVLRWRGEVAKGERLGPRIVACGPILDGPQPVDPARAIAIHDAAEGRRAVADQAAQGADFIKVYEGLSRESYAAILDEAKKRHLPVVGHVPDAVTYEEASDAGQKSVEHLGPLLDTCSTATAEIARQKALPMPEGDFSSFPARIAKRGTLALDTWSAEKCGRLFALLAKNGTWEVPTLVTKRARAYIDDIARANDPRLRFVPAAERESWSPERNFFARYRTPEYIAYEKRAYRKELEMVGAMHRAGVPVLAGTDLVLPFVFAGGSLHDELGLLVEAGLTPLEALQAATRDPARFLGLADTGTIEPGKRADLVLLDADPLADIANTRKIAAVVLHGRLLKRPELDKLLEEAAADAAHTVR